MGINKIYGKLKGNKKVSSLLMMIVGLVVITFSLAFFTDSKEDILGLKIKSYTPSHVVFEYDLSLGDGYVNARDEDLSKQGVKVYKGNYEQNKEDINKGFDNYDYELRGLTSRDSLKSKLGSASGIYTVVLTEFTGTGDSPNNEGLVSVPYFDILGLNTTDLSGLFKGSTSFNQDITSWDVSNVSNMSNMFEGASSFNHDLFEWNVNVREKPANVNTGATNLPDYKLPKVWQDSYKVVFKDRGEVLKTIHEGYHNRPLNSTSEGDLSLPAEPERHTYEFTGWETSEGLTYSESMEMPNNDVIFEAQWKKVKVEIDTGDGIIDVEVDDSGNITLPEVEDKEDEEFVGWEDQDGNIIGGGEDVEFTEGDTFTPIWKPKEYTVRFLSEGSVISTQTVKRGESAVEPSNPSREGYTFDGWDKSYTNITGNLDVNAKWSIRQYTVTFRGHNNTILKTQTVKHGSSATAPANPSKEGYIFMGWDRALTNITGNVTINAKWEDEKLGYVGNLIEQGYVPIASASELNNIRNEGTRKYGVGTEWENNYVSGMDKKYVLVSDIDLTKFTNFEPIGKTSSEFTGTFDGGGYVISNLKISRGSEDFVGLFGRASGATFKNVGLENVNVTGGNHTGGLVGYQHSSSVSNSYATGSVTGRYYTGGLVGNQYSSSVSNSYATGSVTGSGNNTGGLVGYQYRSSVSNSYATGSVTGSGYHTGGLVGYQYNSSVSNSYYDTQTTGQSSSGGGTGKSTADMKNKATYTGWDFESIWIIESNQYPTLR